MAQRMQDSCDWYAALVLGPGQPHARGVVEPGSVGTRGDFSFLRSQARVPGADFPGCGPLRGYGAIANQTKSPVSLHA